MPKHDVITVPVRTVPTGMNWSGDALCVWDLEGRQTLQMTILGHVPSMKNNRRILKNRRTGKRFLPKSDEALGYVEDFCLQVPPEYRSLALGSPRSPLRASVNIFYRSDRSDLDTALIYDCLQVAGVIANDRYILEHHEWKHIDKENPRVEIRIEEI